MQPFIPGTNYFTELDDFVNICLTNKSTLARFAECTGDPNTVALHVDVYQFNCLMTRNDLTFGGGLYLMTGTPDIPSWSQITSSGVMLNFGFNEIPVGDIDGTNTIFTLAHKPNPADSLQVQLNGAYQQAGGGDYTLLGLTITFNTPPVVSSILIAPFYLW